MIGCPLSKTHLHSLYEDTTITRVKLDCWIDYSNMKKNYLEKVNWAEKHWSAEH